MKYLDRRFSVGIHNPRYDEIDWHAREKKNVKGMVDGRVGGNVPPPAPHAEEKDDETGDARRR